MIDTLWKLAHALGWSVHLGGALVMEFVWRPAQKGMPQSQIGVACQWMGRRYRWISAVALATIGVSGLAMLVDGDRSLSLGEPYGRTMLLLVMLWVALAVVLGVLSSSAHPGLHARIPSGASDEERKAATGPGRSGHRPHGQAAPFGTGAHRPCCAGRFQPSRRRALVTVGISKSATGIMES